MVNRPRIQLQSLSSATNWKRVATVDLLFALNNPALVSGLSNKVIRQGGPEVLDSIFSVPGAGMLSGYAPKTSLRRFPAGYDPLS